MVQRSHQLAFPARWKRKQCNMTRRRDLQHHRQSLADIRDIMNSMKTLAYMESRKLGRFLGAQHAVVSSIEEAAADLLSFYPDILPEAEESLPAYILVGTERGFCGDFNHALLNQLDTTLEGSSPDKPVLIATGHKLHTVLEGDERVAAMIDGASVAEEVTATLQQLVSELSDLHNEHGINTVYCLYHDAEGDIVMQKVLPPFKPFTHALPRFSHPPVLNMSPGDFLIDLTDHYLFAALHEILYSSLMAENQRRIAHLEGAVKHLDDESEDLTRQYNTLRQEEITEEIEIILLSASNLDEDWLKHGPSHSVDSTPKKDA
jgi:F-type H+-transporting ATPase subunit gamma